MGATQTFTKKVVIKDDYVKKDGTCPLYIYVSIDGKWDRIPLKLSWPPGHFDKEAGRILPRRKDDPDYSDYTLIIDSEIAKINDIMKEYRLAKRQLPLDQLLKEYNSFSSRRDFLTFFRSDCQERYKRKKIEEGSRKGHLSSLNTLTEYWQYEQRKKNKKLLPNEPVQMPFSELTPKNLENFRAWLKSHKDNGPSTVENHMKNVRTYVKRALAAKYAFEDPFKVVKVKKVETYPNVLEQEQLIELLESMKQPTINDTWQKVLRHFLFSCFTGLRISDILTVDHQNIQGDWLVITPKKTLRIGKVVRIPLHPQARTFIDTSIGKLFETFSEQYTNRVLGDISEAMNLGWKMTTHTARHTFGTLFIELGGDVVTLKEYMGHRDIGTTMKYVHISEKRKKEKINVFDKLFTKPEGPKKAA